MARSLGIFAALGAAVALLVGTAVWWVGPRLVDLAVLDPQRDQPYMLLDFARGLPSDVYRARYQRPLSGLVASEGGEFYGAYRLAQLVEGKQAHEWTYLTRLRMARAQDLVQVMTSSPYRRMANVLPDLRTVQLGNYATDTDDWRGAVIVWLVEVHAEQASDPLAVVTDELPGSGGRIVLDGPVSVLADGQPWNRILVVDFANSREAFAWLRHTRTATARALANARARNLALAVYVDELG